jgi:hypothetical protein
MLGADHASDSVDTIRLRDDRPDPKQAAKRSALLDSAVASERLAWDQGRARYPIYHHRCSLNATRNTLAL